MVKTSSIDYYDSTLTGDIELKGSISNRTAACLRHIDQSESRITAEQERKAMFNPCMSDAEHKNDPTRDID